MGRLRWQGSDAARNPGDGARMEPSIFSFIVKYSWRQQATILALSVALLPLNYYSYELPKQIVNGPIQGGVQ